MSTSTGLETEVKIPIVDPAATGRKIIALGFSISAPRGFEANTLYDKSGHELANREMLLRLREDPSGCLITWKGPTIPGPHKKRPELETSVGSAKTLDQILRALGYQPTFRYEKYRTEYTQAADKGEGTVMLDETPIGNFMELEGTSEWIDGTAQKLGFGARDYVLSSYVKLYFEYCARRGLEPGNMVFASH